MDLGYIYFSCKQEKNDPESESKKGGREREQGGTKSVAYLLLGNASADNQLSGRRAWIPRPGWWLWQDHISL